MNQELEDVISGIAKENHEYTMNLSVRDIQAMIKAQLGYEPSTSTVAKILRDLGYDTKQAGRRSWVYKHKESHE